MLNKMFGKIILKNRSSGLNKPQASYGALSITNDSPFLSVTECTHAFLWILTFLPADDLLHITLLSKSYYNAFHDPQIFSPLKEFFSLTTNTDLDELSTLFTTERDRRQSVDFIDKVFKHAPFQSCFSRYILCFDISRNTRADYEFTGNQFIIQKCLLKSLHIAFWCLSIVSSLSFFVVAIDNNIEWEKQYEYMTIFIFIMFGTTFSALCFTATCTAYTSCCKPLSYYRSQQSKLDTIRNNINNVKITNTLFTNKERAGVNNDLTETSPMEEGLLSNFLDEAEPLEEALEYNTTIGREKSP
jgi:hypothetical protein